MLQLLAKAAEVPAIFLTFTYSATYPDAAGCKADWRVVGQRLLRAADRAGLAVCMVWRVEFQERGAPHVHVLLWQQGNPTRPVSQCLGPRSSAVATAYASRGRAATIKARPIRAGSKWDWLAAAAVVWSDRTLRVCTEVGHVSSNGVDVDYVGSHQKSVYYVAKYCAKVDQSQDRSASADRTATTGRVWGIRGDRRVLSLASLVRFTLEDSDSTRRTLDQFWQSEGNLVAQESEQACGVSYFGFLRDGGCARFFDAIAAGLFDRVRVPGLQSLALGP